MDLDGDKNVIESEFVDDLLADGWSKEAAEGLFKGTRRPCADRALTVC